MINWEESDRERDLEHNLVTSYSGASAREIATYYLEAVATMKGEWVGVKIEDIRTLAIGYFADPVGR
jgi:hypothetical protein